MFFQQPQQKGECVCLCMFMHLAVPMCVCVCIHMSSSEETCSVHIMPICLLVGYMTELLFKVSLPKAKKFCSWALDRCTAWLLKDFREQVQEKSRSDRKEKKIDKGLERDILKTFFLRGCFNVSLVRCFEFEICIITVFKSLFKVWIH